jgi:hypothetical protein
MFKYTTDLIKLKHLSLVSTKDVDYKTIMTEVFNYKNNWLDRNLIGKLKFKEAIKIIMKFNSTIISETQLMEEVGLELPKNIDNITFQSRIETASIMEKESDPVKMISSVIANITFNHYHKVDFNSDSFAYKRFKEHILNLPLINMLNLYNVIKLKLSKSNEQWNNLFKQVEIKDADFEEANGQLILGRFNLLKTQKKIHQDFGIEFKKEFLMSYSMVKWNNLEKASEAYIQQTMSNIKERNYKRKSKQQKH